MRSLLSLPILVSLLSAFVSAQNIEIPNSASPVQLETVDAQYVNEGFPNADQKVGFGIPLKSQALVTAVYGGILVQGQGQSLTKDQVATLPTVYITPSDSSKSNFTTGQAFTLMLADASAVGHPDPQGNFRHFLANSINPGSPVSDTNSTAQLSGGQTITNYAGPGPNAGEGPHRYAWLVFQQPSDFAAPSNLSQAGTSPNHWSVQSYVSSSKLGDLVGAAFFTVENGQASYSVAPTSSVNPSTLGGASASSGSQSGSAPASSQTGGDSGSGAGRMMVSAGLGMAGVGAAALALL